MGLLGKGKQKDIVGGLGVDRDDIMRDWLRGRWTRRVLKEVTGNWVLKEERRGWVPGTQPPAWLALP